MTLLLIILALAVVFPPLRRLMESADKAMDDAGFNLYKDE
jgi:hypothetical protein